MKYGVWLVVLSTCASVSASPERIRHSAERSRELFVKAIEDPELARAMSRVTNAELISVRQVFILASSDSHVNYEIRFGPPDGTGGFTWVQCLPLTLHYRHPDEERYFSRALEACLNSSSELRATARRESRSEAIPEPEFPD